MENKKILTAIIITAIFGLTSLVCFASDLVIESKNQSYSEAESKIKFDGDVNVTIDDLHIVGETADVTVINNEKLDTATFYDKPYAYENKANKKREVKANILKVSLIKKTVRAEGDTQTVIFDGKTPIAVVNADMQEYNTKTGVMIAEGNVTINYKSDIKAFSNNAEFKTDKNGGLKDIKLTGNAIVKNEENEVQADKITYNAATNYFVATGRTNTKAINKDGNVLTLYSDRQEFNQLTNFYNATGNVKIYYEDYFAQGPKVVIYPDKVTKKPGEIYFVGRSSITQGMRTIFADKIKMTTNPKNFKAEGNTRTVIKNINESHDSDMGLGL